MTLNGVDTRNHGMIVEKVVGAHAMPGRMAPYLYDWGDSLEPLLTETYVGWSPRRFAVSFFYDPRFRTLGGIDNDYVETWVRSFADSGEITLVLSDAVGALGTHTVRLTSIDGVKHYRGGQARLQATFTEYSPAFNGSVPGAKSGGPSSIDGYSFSQFNAQIMSVTNVRGLGSTIPSRATVINAAPLGTNYRSWSPYTVQLIIRGSGSVAAIHSLQKVLTKNAVLPFVYDGLTFDCISTAGWMPLKVKDNVFKVPLNLLRI